MGLSSCWFVAGLSGVMQRAFRPEPSRVRCHIIFGSVSPNKRGDPQVALTCNALCLNGAVWMT